MRQRVSRRYLAVWYPQLPLDRWVRRDDPRLSGAFAVTERISNADRILCPNKPAISRGVRPGQSVTDAYALCPDLLIEPRDEMREARLLSALHIWADRFSPCVSMEPPDSLLLDVSGMTPVFGSEISLAQSLLDGLHDLKMVARLGLANTKRAAQGFARYGRSPIHITQAECETEEIKSLPIAALGLERSIALDFKRLGVKTIGDLSTFKSSELARRFSVHVPDALDAFRGYRHDPLVPNAAKRIFSASRTLPEPIGRVEDVTALLTLLAERVCRDLTQAGLATRGFRLHVRCVEVGDIPLEVGFSTPMREVAPILRQFRRPIEGLQLPFGADGFRLIATSVEIFKAHQTDLEDTASQSDRALQQTLTTLGNRLGFDRLRRPIGLPGHTPETEHGSVDVVDQDKRRTNLNGEIDTHRYPRPEQIWPAQAIRVEIPGRPPKGFTYLGRTRTVIRAFGPERVSSVWWQAPPSCFAAHTRDFWRATTEDGRCFWLMMCADAPDLGWFCCGEFLVEPRFTFEMSRASLVETG